MDFKNIKFSTIIVIIAFLIIGLYALTEVNYFAYKNVAESNDTNASVVIIPSIGVFEKINNVSISQGVYIDDYSNIPTKGDVVLFGHRTLQGSPFLRLDTLKKGDIITLEWPGIGEVNYTFKESKIVSPTNDLKLNESHETGDIHKQELFLVTCHPIGSTAERLVVTADLDSISLINETALEENPQAHWAWFIMLGFLVLGLIVVYFTPVEERKIILAVVIAITIVLIYFCIFPVSSQIWADQLGWLNSLMGIN
ncbi:class E sortase [Methanobrevibacter olleyae]|uniref:LPXTG-site transpeptidase (Sortase) family protein n=1 Tax=Methanobrevibacter olleyae TaxID=294671 RepID=A0A126R191_METOL|nr:class E sortase [Methanobrevibacter olleyae]AMK15847.1 sortase family protein [Methanobrevibacter olleyae]SFL20519.1 LPXTG-site transpeptidase (sortase) family protein [Methanobrevibacter olleyae]